MSVNRENVTWLSPRDGLWYAGFFDFWSVNQDSPDYDYEWDVEYDKSCFRKVTEEGYPTWEEAYHELSSRGANPGGTWTTPEPEDGARYDAMADACRKGSAW